MDLVDLGSLPWPRARAARRLGFGAVCHLPGLAIRLPRFPLPPPPRVVEPAPLAVPPPPHTTGLSRPAPRRR